MSEPTIPWRDGLAEFLPPVKKAQAIIRDVIGLHCDRHPVTYERGNTVAADADELTADIMQALTKEEP